MTWRVFGHASMPLRASSGRTAMEDNQKARGRLALLAQAIGSFCIGTSEFSSMGILQLCANRSF
ncbi:hypothetical protein GR212_33785 [Rhizobium lusitanum]|uniref:Uncharacterized protein n=1 Tax=Rhizobium lusitanum TaxID=293958 RepID=A0A6L9UGR8_9HYPH|nr:hypothetical protein [Rhizobium lusitanum]NEI74521.1 hypothetical protein [Rhizobium lusitanum]